MRYSFLLISLFTLSFAGLSQINKYGNPFIYNYTPKQYQASEQNWAVMQDSRGVMYFGNNDNGVLEYDGKNWRNIPIMNSSIVRSLSIDKNGKIYVGAVNDFGYLEPDNLGSMEYHSLSDKIKGIIGQYADIWKIYHYSDKIYFIALEYIFIYDHDSIDAIKLPKESFLSYFVDDNYFLSNTGKGLANIKIDDISETTIEQAKYDEFYKNQFVLAILPYKEEGSVIIATYSKGLYHYILSAQNSIPVRGTINNADAHDYLMKNNAFHGIEMSPDKYGFATYQKGTIITDMKGNILESLSKDNGLQDETALFLYTNTNKSIDNQLWMALNRGISRAETNSPIRSFPEQTTVNDLIMYNDILYTANDYGVSYLTYNENGFPEFKNIDNIENQTWSLIEFKIYKNNKVVQKKLLAGSGDGLYEINDKKGIAIANNYNCRKLYQSKTNTEKLYIGYKGGLGTITYQNGKWNDHGSIKGFSDIVTSIQEDSNENLWLGTYFNGVIKVETEDTLLTRYGTANGLPSKKDNIIYNYNDRLLIATQKGLYRYNERNDIFIPDTIFGIELTNGSKGIYRFKKDQFNNYWMVISDENKHWIEKIQKDSTGSFTVQKTAFKRLPSMSYQDIFVDDENIAWIGGPDGLFSFNNNITNSYNDTFNILIRKIVIGGDSVIFKGTNYKIGEKGEKIVTNQQSDIFIPELDYHNNSISFDFAAAFFIEEDYTEYSHKLEGFDKSWTRWDKETRAVFTNLNEGDYIFNVKSRNIYGVVSNIASYTFTIEPPWYRTILAYALYLAAFIFFVWFMIKYNIRRLEKEKEILEGIVKERTAEIVKQKEEIEKAYKNVKMLSKIGQDVTANLSVERIVEIVYHNVNALMEAPVFAIGLYNEKENAIDFLGKETKEGDIIRTRDQLASENQLSVKCFETQKEIVINNFTGDHHDLKQYRNDDEFKPRESLIYLPLTTKEKKIGTITVQSFNKWAYSDYNVNMLRNLAVYVAIALDNAEAYEQIESQKNEIERQRDIVIRQKQEITDSILYAKRIQSAVLPPTELITQNIPEHFVLFKPRDIVSGDFYWMKQIREYVVICVADCTGHGVPGAFMSMLGIALLNEIVRKKTVATASDVLNELRAQVKLSLRQTGKSDEAKDGMDISLCLIDVQKRTLNYAGAYNPLYIFRNKEHKEFPTDNSEVIFDDEVNNLFELKADKMPIGIHLKEKDSFTDYYLKILDGDTYYMFTDGYPDQIGGEFRKKYMTKPFKKLLLGIQDRSLDEQSEILNKTIEDWKSYPDSNGNGYEQMDDITIIGLRF